MASLFFNRKTNAHHLITVIVKTNTKLYQIISNYLMEIACTICEQIAVRKTKHNTYNTQTIYTTP